MARIAASKTEGMGSIPIKTTKKIKNYGRT